VLVNRLRSTYWFLPALVTVACIGAGLVLTAVDRMNPDATAWLGWAYGGGAAGARALLSAVAGSTITVVSVTFSVMVVALTVSSQHFGPRLLNSFMRDPASQLVLGTFTGTFAYCLVVLRTVQGDGGEDYSVFVPHLAVTVSVVLTLFSVAMLIYYVHHIASSMQVSEITVRVADDFERTIERLYPDLLGDEGPPRMSDRLHVPPDAVRVHSDSSGYLQGIHGEAVLALASDESLTVWLTARPGDFVTEGTALGAAHPAPRDLEAFARRLRQACTLGSDRTSEQDIGFAAQQLAEVALRALSPGVNEPFTAMTCIDRLGQGLARLATRRLPNPVRRDDGGAPRVVARPREFDELVEEIFEPIVISAAPHPAVLERVLATLRMLAGMAQRQTDRDAIFRLGDQVHSVAVRLDEPGRSRVARRYDELLSLTNVAKTSRPTDVT
jgi:uncharacterized membrane protein